MAGFIIQVELDYADGASAVGYVRTVAGELVAPGSSRVYATHVGALRAARAHYYRVSAPQLPDASRVVHAAYTVAPVSD